MRIAVAQAADGLPQLGQVIDGQFLPVRRAAEGEHTDLLVDSLRSAVDLSTLPSWSAAVPLSDLRLLPPVRLPQKILCIGLNYADHARESGMEPPAAPLVFAKYPNTLVGHDQPVTYDATQTGQLDYEAELAVVIGRRAKAVTEADALSHVFGYTCANDVSARDVQLGDGQWTRGKSFDDFCPLGPWLVTADEIPDPQSLGISLRVNGEILQDSNTKEMIFSVAQIISFLSQTMTLEPGDLILTGTPYGVGMGRTPQRWLAAGDVMEVTIEAIGSLSNHVVANGSDDAL